MAARLRFEVARFQRRQIQRLANVRQDLTFLTLAEQVLRRLGPLHVDAAAHRAFFLAGLALEVMHDRWPPFSPGKISMLSMLPATLRLLSERAGLEPAHVVLVAIRGPWVAGLRLVRFVVATIDNLLRRVLKLQHQVTERGGLTFAIFFAL